MEPLSPFYSRNQFIKLVSVGTFGAFVIQSHETHAQEKIPLKPDLVKEFVIAGHGNLEKTKLLLEANPGLLNASWDWGNGDFEEAIEGAGHVGNREIALYLINKGARFTLFVAAMLGKIEIVKSMIEPYPELIKSKGPHGLDLIHHATKGGENATEVLNYLKSKS
ncbi:MAG: hypothetical protein ABI663_15670 [Chryseolinea sp.]